MKTKPHLSRHLEAQWDLTKDDQRLLKTLLYIACPVCDRLFSLSYYLEGRFLAMSHICILFLLR